MLSRVGESKGDGSTRATMICYFAASIDNDVPSRRSRKYVCHRTIQMAARPIATMTIPNAIPDLISGDMRELANDVQAKSEWQGD